MKWGNTQNQVVNNSLKTITASNNAQKKFAGSFLLAQICIMLVLSAMATVIIVNAIPTPAAPPITYTVSIYDKNTFENKDEFNDTYTITHGNKLSLPIPTKFDNTFDNWYTNAAHTKAFSPQTDTITQDIKLYPGFKKNLYTISFIDPRLYLKEDGSLNEEYKLQNEVQVFTKPAGSSFTLPQLPDSPTGTDLSHCGIFKGWSHSMHYISPNDGSENIFAQPGEKYENFFRQNITYWAAFDNWDLPQIIDHPDRVIYENGIYINPLADLPATASDLQSRIDAPFAPMESDLTRIPTPLPSDLPFTLPNMPFSILNTNYTTYSFAGWILEDEYTGTQRIYRDGEAIRPEALSNYFNQINKDIIELNFYALWIANDGTNSHYFT